MSTTAPQPQDPALPTPPSGRPVALVTAVCTPLWLVGVGAGLVVLSAVVFSVLSINALVGVLLALIVIGVAQWLVVPRCPLPPLKVETVADREQEWGYRAWLSRWGAHVRWGHRAEFNAASERLSAELEGRDPAPPVTAGEGGGGT